MSWSHRPAGRSRLGLASIELAVVTPSLEELSISLDNGQGNGAAGNELRQKFPTSAIAALALSTEWAAVDAGTATLECFAVPRG